MWHHTFALYSPVEWGKQKSCTNTKKKLEDDNVTCVLIIPPEMDTVPKSNDMFYKLDLLNKNPEDDAAAMQELDAAIIAKQDELELEKKRVTSGTLVERPKGSFSSLMRF
jgi:hypothetical protein